MVEIIINGRKISENPKKLVFLDRISNNLSRISKIFLEKPLTPKCWIFKDFVSVGNDFEQ